MRFTGIDEWNGMKYDFEVTNIEIGYNSEVGADMISCIIKTDKGQLDIAEFITDGEAERTDSNIHHNLFEYLEELFEPETPRITVPLTAIYDALDKLIELENNKRKNEKLIKKISDSYNEENIARHMIENDIYQLDCNPLEKEKRITALHTLISKSQQLSDLMVSQEVLQTAIRIATGNDEDKIKELIASAKDRIRNDKSNMYHDLLDVKRYKG